MKNVYASRVPPRPGQRPKQEKPKFSSCFLDLFGQKQAQIVATIQRKKSDLIRLNFSFLFSTFVGRFFFDIFGPFSDTFS